MSTLCPYFDKLTPQVIVNTYANKGYPLFTEGDYNLNVFGIRTNEDISDRFNDVIGLLFKEHGAWVLKTYHATVDPGVYARKHPMNKNGTAIICEGYYKGAYSIGLHQGKYKALKQVKPLKYDRMQANPEGKIVRSGNYTTEIAGTNIHRATANVNGVSTYISSANSSWSYGCCVIASNRDFKEFMSYADKAAEIYGNSFSFALFGEKDLCLS